MLSRALQLTIIVVAAAFVGMTGNGSRLPLDEHEVFVARTAEEMLQRGSAVVPYLNDQPRLTKPPLAYWLAMAADRVGDRDGMISEWEARVPSIVAGILLALTTFFLTSALFGDRTGFIAALLLVSGSGFVSYTHSARPEMMYAMFCTAALACFAKSWLRSNQVAGPSGLVWPWLGWFSIGIAILSKGPQLPLILIAAWCIGMWRIGEGTRILRVVRPFSGLIIAAAVSLWWFITIWASVSHSGSTMEHETIGRIFDFEDEPLTRYLDPYYVYRTAGLFLPWVLLYALALLAPLIREIRMPSAAKLLWWVAIVTIAAMHVTLNRRWYYLLPLTGVLAALMSWGGLAAGAAMINAGRAWIWRLLAALHIIACVAALFWMWRSNVEFLKPTIVALLTMTSVGGIAIAMLFARQLAETAIRPVMLSIVSALALGLLAAQRDSLWRPMRYVRRDFDREVARLVPSNELLLSWHDDWEIELYAVHRVIPAVDSADDLRKALPPTGTAWVLVNSRQHFEPPADLSCEIVIRWLLKGNEELQLWRVTATRN